MNNFEVSIYKHNSVRHIYGIYCKGSRTFAVVGGRKKDLDKKCNELNAGI